MKLLSPGSSVLSDCYLYKCQVISKSVKHKSDVAHTSHHSKHVAETYEVQIEFWLLRSCSKQHKTNDKTGRRYKYSGISDTEIKIVTLIVQGFSHQLVLTLENFD